MKSLPWTYNWHTSQLNSGPKVVKSTLSIFNSFMCARWSLSPAERKRFYRDASVYQQSREDGGQFGIHLDHRKLRTPLRKLFLVPSERLAHAVAQEWGAQGQFVQPSLMHITALCNTVIDDPHKRSVDQIIHSLMAYLQSDTLWYIHVHAWMSIFSYSALHHHYVFPYLIVAFVQLNQMTSLLCNNRSGTLSSCGLMRGKSSTLPPSLQPRERVSEWEIE